MEAESTSTLQSIFEGIEDPRVERTKRHQLLDIMSIAILGVLCGAEGWVEIEAFGKTKEAWLKTFLELPNGIPSHDTFGRVFARIDAKQFEECFLNWVRGVTEKITGVIAIDGKTLRRSHDAANGEKALHLVSAWPVENRMALALKENQGTLYEDVKDTFTLAQTDHFRDIEYQFHETIEKGHGRLEIRKHWLIDDLEHLAYLDPAGKRKGLRAIGMVLAQRPIGLEVSTQARYYLLSFERGVTRFAASPLRFAVIGALKTVCIGPLTSLFGKMSHVFASAMLTTIWRCFVISP